jgi:tRNA(Ile)-lysidine synthase
LLVLARAARCDVVAIHVDHGLRVGSASEAEVVRAAAERFGAAFRSERIEIAPGPNLEARARRARYTVLPADVATGHTADDQAETVLLNILRGTGLDGLAVMGGPRHPILGLRRAETHALCATLGLQPVDDPSNADPSFVRNRIRHELLPLLDDIAERDVVSLLMRLAAVAGDDLAVVEELASAIDPTDAKAIASAAPAVARRVIRRWLTRDGYPPDLASVERVLSVARGDAIACEIVGGLEVRRSGQRLRVTE